MTQRWGRGNPPQRGTGPPYGPAVASVFRRAAGARGAARAGGGRAGCGSRSGLSPVGVGLAAGGGCARCCGWAPGRWPVARGALAPAPSRSPGACGRPWWCAGGVSGGASSLRADPAVRRSRQALGGLPFCGPPVASLPAGCGRFAPLRGAPGGSSGRPPPGERVHGLEPVVGWGRKRGPVVVRRHRRGRAEDLRWGRARRSWTPSRRVRAGSGPGEGKDGWQGGGSARPGRLLKDHGSSGKNPGQKPFPAR